MLTYLLIPIVKCQDDPDFALHGLNCREVMREPDNPCYSRAVQRSCCESCGRLRTNITGCEYGDRDKLTCDSISSCQGQEDVCCRTCRSRSMSPSLNNSFFVTVSALVVWHLASCTVTIPITRDS
ncbi:hypothetical protein Btru_043001 [Bulinus truncatus]|nr:hypothetical protein Btru_043001 [Bulinus truncatus]